MRNHSVTREQLEAIAKYLNVDVRELFYPGVKPVEMSEEIKQFLFQLIKEDQLIQTDNEVEDYKRKGTAIDACVVLFGMNSDEVKRIIEM